MMNQSFIQIVGVLSVLITAFLLLVVVKPRLSLAILFIQYVGVFLIISTVWPLTISLVKLFSGSAAVIVLILSTFTHMPADKPKNTTKQADSIKNSRLASLLDTLSGNMFRLLAAGLVLIVVVSITPRAVNWISGATIPSVFAGLLLISLGLLKLGLTKRVLNVFIGLFTFLSGFEIIYASVENATLVTGLLAGVTLALSLVGAYLVTANETNLNL